jgi:hypothetical protein
MALQKKQEKDEQSERGPKGYKLRIPPREELLTNKRPQPKQPGSGQA